MTFLSDYLHAVKSFLRFLLDFFCNTYISFLIINFVTIDVVEFSNSESNLRHLHCNRATHAHFNCLTINFKAAHA